MDTERTARRRAARAAAAALTVAALTGGLASCTWWRRPQPEPRSTGRASLPARSSAKPPTTAPPTTAPPSTRRPPPPPTTSPVAPPPTPPAAPPSTARRVAPSAASPATGDWRAQMLAMVNAERAKSGLRPLALCASLNRAAQSFAEELDRRGVLTHTGADGSTPARRAEAAGYRAARGQLYIHGAENAAVGYSVTDVTSRWLASPGHRTNILSATATHIGLGRQNMMWVQTFGSGGTC